MARSSSLTLRWAPRRICLVVSSTRSVHPFGAQIMKGPIRSRKVAGWSMPLGGFYCITVEHLLQQPPVKTGPHTQPNENIPPSPYIPLGSQKVRGPFGPSGNVTRIRRPYVSFSLHSALAASSCSMKAGSGWFAHICCRRDHVQSHLAEFPPALRRTSS